MTLEKQGEPITFVGSSGIELKGIYYSPEEQKDHLRVKFQAVQPSIYFVHGLSGRWADYKSVLIPLSDEFRVFAYDQRGHGSSPGVYSPQKAVDDLEAIVEREEGNPVGLLGQSIGCRTAVEVAKRFESKGKPLKGVYMLQPYLGVDSFGNINKSLFRAISFLYPLLSPIDLLLTVLPFVRHPLGLNQVFPIYTCGAVSKISSGDCEGLINTPVGYMLADNDTLLGTNDADHYLACMARMIKLFSKPNSSQIPWNDGLVVAGLNHCFNYKGHKPFLKEEPGKNSGKIVDKMAAFFRSIFERH